MQRYFVKNGQINGNVVTMKEEDAHHIKHVMRMKTGNRVFICNEDGDCFLSTLVRVEGANIVFNVEQRVNANPELPVEVTIAHGLVRREKMEEVIQKITELGAICYIPLKMERSIVKITESIDEKKQIRLQKIVKEAAEQSHRIKQMVVENPISLNALISMKDRFDLCIFAYEQASKNEGMSLRQVLSRFKGKKILVVIGPEGGISDQEAKKIQDSGFYPVSLGPRILRTETAPQYVMAAIGYAFELGE